jgi:beta-glucosidase-like glycosyl hydrolase
VKHLVVSLAVLMMAGCSRAPAPEWTEPEPAESAPQVGVQPGVVPIDAEPPLRPREHAPSVSELSLRDKAAQLIMPWIGGEYWSSDADATQQTLRLVSEERVGGFVTGISASPYDLAAKFNTLQRASRLPLLIAADLESGPGQRFRGGTVFPGNMALGATRREDDAYAVGRVIAREARAVGIHMDFAPVVDVNNNPANPIINIRSFGEDPVHVGRMGAAFIRGLRDNGVLATAKHFPGHGDTGSDSHIMLPVIRTDRTRLDSIELVPFRIAVNAGVDAVMTAHIALPLVTGDSALPATLSPVMLDTILRGDMGFRGLVVTDALNMGAVVNRYGAAQAAVMALRAGADILLMPTDVRAAVDAIVNAVASGAIPLERLEQSVQRVLDAKERLGLFRRRLVDLNQLARHVGARADRETAEAIARRSLVLVRDDSGLVPLPESRRRVLVIAINDEGSTGLGTVFSQQLRTGVQSLQLMRIFPASGPPSYDSVRTAAARAGVVVVIASARPVSWQPSAVAIPDSAAALIQQLAVQGLPVVVVSAGSPYLIGQMPAVPGYLVSWSGSELAERAAADALLGRTDITGRLPVSLPPWFVLGAGLTRVGRAAQ